MEHTADRRFLLYAALCLSPLAPALLFPGIGALASFAIVIVTLIVVKPSRRPTLALRYGGAAQSIAVGVAFGLAIALSFHLLIDPLIVRLTGSPINLESVAGVEGNLVNFLVLLAIGLVVGGVLEELTFRGFVIGWGASVFGERAAPWLVLASAGVFGAAHLYQGVAGMMSTGLVGLLLGFLYLFAGRKLLPSIVAHMTINTYGITLLYLGFG